MPSHQINLVCKLKKKSISNVGINRSRSVLENNAWFNNGKHNFPSDKWYSSGSQMISIVIVKPKDVGVFHHGFEIHYEISDTIHRLPVVSENAAKMLMGIKAERKNCLCARGLEIMGQYFKKENTVSTFDYKDARIGFSYEIKKCGMQKTELSVRYNASIWYISKEKLRRKLRDPELFYLQEENDSISVVLPNLEKILHIMYLDSRVTMNNVNGVLISAWKQSHILNLTVFHTVNIMKALQENYFVVRDNIRELVHTVVLERIEDTGWIKLKIMNTCSLNVHGLMYETRNVPITKSISDTSNFKTNESNLELVANEYMDRTVTKLSLVCCEQKYSVFKIFNPGISAALASAYLAMVITLRWFQKPYCEWRTNYSGRSDFWSQLSGVMHAACSSVGRSCP